MSATASPRSAQLDDYVRRLVAEAPELTAVQRATIRGALRSAPAPKRASA
ncbi:hypothetical protein G3R41_08765 [Modestobacter muralis]|uniref:Uncharacterized protein n=1 Tax=Modestobacter muralis TaxID=1608614 RepID=A0A6P0H5P9_9ACTN|nr:hypothetical protein [Modestobacter muralis]NEN51031.1 hypothetical protein [Modestobacter muralis]